MDKDGISAACVFAEIANWLCAAEQHKTLQQKLIEIYEQYELILESCSPMHYSFDFRYGYHITRNSYLEEQSTGTIPKIFMDLRENHPSYTEKIGKYAVRYVCDPTMNYDNSKHGNKSVRLTILFFRLNNENLSIKFLLVVAKKFFGYDHLHTGKWKYNHSSWKWH